MGRRARCLHRLLFLGCLAWALAQTNVTVDDQLLSANTSAGFSLQYLPDDVWQQGNGCAACALHPSPSSMFQNTWHDTSTGSKLLARQIEVNFIGTAIYVFFTVPDLLNSPGLVPFTTNLTFTLDGEMVGQYSHQPEGTTDYLYNVPCYTNDSLSPGSHFLDVSVEPYNGSPSFALFDYLIYTASDATTSTASFNVAKESNIGSMSWSTTTMTTSSASFKTSGTSFNQTLVPSSTPSPSPSPVIVATTISTLTYVSSGEAAANSPSGGTQSPVKNSSSSNSPTSLIVGAVAAGLVGLMLLVVATTLLLRIVRRKALSHPPRLDLDNMSESAEGRETLMRSTLLHSQPSSSSHASLLASSFYSSEEDARSVFRPISGSVQSSSERRALVRSSHTTEASQLESHDDTSGHTRVLLDRIQALEQSLSQLTEREEWPPAYSAA